MFNSSGIAAITAGLIILTSSVTPGQNYNWPVKIPPKLSSQFGDYRAGHWHAGIDITTRGKPGYKVYAISDGYIFRVRTSFWGYGNALYLKLDDGRFAIYGHLARFSDQIDDYVNRRQLESKQYYQDLFFGSGQYRVKQGEYIALSGQSGAGAPHLHLEIRDPNNLPVNPLCGFYKLADNESPVIDYLVIKRYRQVGPGNWHDLEFIKIDGKRPFYQVRDTVAVYGQCVFAIAGNDPDNSYLFGLFGASLVLDGNEIFGFKNEKMDYSTGYQIDYVRDLELKQLVESINGFKEDNDRNVFYRLYIQPGDQQLFYDRSGFPAGVIFADSLDDIVHDLRIMVSDNNNNISELRLFLKKASLPDPEIEFMTLVDDTLLIKSNDIGQEKSIKLQRRRHGADVYKTIDVSTDLFEGKSSCAIDGKNYQYRLRLDGQNSEFSRWIEFETAVAGEDVRAFADYLDITVTDEEALRINNISLEKFYTLPLPGGYYKALVPVPVKNGYFEVSLKGTRSSHDYYILSTNGVAFSPDSSIRLEIGKHNLYYPALIKLSRPSELGDGYEFTVEPYDLLFAGGVSIQVDHQRLALDPTRSSLYYYLSSKARWVFIGGNSSGSITGETGGGGRFGVFKDVEGPAIRGVKPANGSSISDRTPYLACRISDNLSGLKSETQLEMTIDGIWVPAYYDIDSKEYGYQVKNPLRAADHILRIRAVDNQGNESIAVSRFSIR